MTAHFATGIGAGDAPVPRLKGGAVGFQAETLAMRVQAIRYEAETIRSVELHPVTGDRVPAFEAGAHVDLALPGDLIRSYSLINGPEQRNAYVVAVNRDAESTGGSQYICERLRVGDILEVTTARNTFALADTGAPVVLFAGGIGITPILSMIRHLEARQADWSLVYAVRARANAAFLDVLAELDAGRGRVHLHVDDEAGALLDLAAQFARVPADAHVYCCGPVPMIDAFEVLGRGRAAELVHVERFVGADVAGAETGFTVVLKRSGREVVVPAGKTIMEVLKEEGIRVAYSCQSGVCGTCETRVIEGVPDHRDNVLSARERERGNVMMICCSLAQSDRLVLDL
ncbi:oxidoreductase [Pseudooceanicola sediminis]|uniref:Oxidoreductase n=1 Tax=Pseudooceanicola sediminis TaxID=2211117 RepID=A0A399J6G1_9RHOB|nr:PDR/VanB family oxidoreductase [Pseudooceanicola sediminis]KAA2317218.1 oxidoreductase [Puniceibacterium sp. HSS470]RII39572.1 oxidoreductase [Pseudooceanicola sediminis]|tara:strand:+ start:3393 stop:4424 length:1032 start_codon:yes stop_codon:yes gene_type:complete